MTVQLPNGWPLCALILACARAGAAVSPVLPTMRRRELEFMLGVTESPVYIGPTSWHRFDYGAMAAEVAAAVPTLRHRVLVGEDVPTDDPAVVDFYRDLYGRDRTAEFPAALLDEREAKAGDVAQVMFTSGTTGEPKGVTHTHNTLYAIDKAQADVLQPVRGRGHRDGVADHAPGRLHLESADALVARRHRRPSGPVAAGSHAAHSGRAESHVFFSWARRRFWPT
ncbi:AMP-binding protein [Fodinicola feengrottensis]|uniref:AMP-binding protein n=1 Tax=Fodinicola feengrottensis TaxID=435914 RepID=UPI0024420442|nr:AMP-binding protein [Fodinicola feengrottensis]